MSDTAVVICGAGIGGVATAFHLVVELGVEGVVLCDPRPPLTLTSDKSTECYRNWWPTLEMVSFMNRSIDILEDLDRRSSRAFNLNRQGYLYVTARPEALERLETEGRVVSAHGAGPLRVHNGSGTYEPDRHVDGADLLHRRVLTETHPYLSEAAVGALHVRRAGWMSAQQLGAWMLQQAIESGLTLIPQAVVEVEVSGGGVHAVRLADYTRVEAGRFVNAAGPMLGPVGKLVGVDMPVISEAHHKLSFRDSLGAVPRDAPMLIWCDPQSIGWTDDERSMLTEAGRTDLTGEMPSYCHGRPEGGEGSTWVLALWEYVRTVTEPHWPMPDDELYAEVVIRGMATMIPAMSGYANHLPQPFVDGGYYTKAHDNLPLIGPIGPVGSFVCGGLSGYGVMAAPAAGELAARHLMGLPLPAWAEHFIPARFDDPGYVDRIASSDSGQL